TLVAFKHRDVVRPRPPSQLHGAGTGGPTLPARLGCGLARPFDEHFHGLADPAAMVGQADRVLDCQQVVVAPPLDFPGHVGGVPLVALGARPGAVLEDEAVLEPGPADQLAGALERLLGFPREADDEVAADRHPGHLLPAAG